MHWLDLCDCVLLSLLVVHCIQPVGIDVHPLLLLIGFIGKECLNRYNVSLLAARISVAVVSVLQVYTTKLWGYCSTWRQHVVADSSHVQIRCMHDAVADVWPHVADLYCDKCINYAAQYNWKGQQYVLLVPPTIAAIDVNTHICRYVDIYAKGKRIMWKRAKLFTEVWLMSSEGQRLLDLTDAVTQVLGPERDGHLALTNGESLEVCPLSTLMWLAKANSELIGQLRDAKGTFHLCVFTDPAPEEGSGSGSGTRILKDQEFTMADLLDLCVKVK